MTTYIHPLADIHPDAEIGEGVRIYAGTRIGPNAKIGKGTTIGRNCEIDGIVGNYCKIQAAALIYHGVNIGHWVFIGPRFTSTNDIDPDAYTDDWSDRFRETHIGHAASIGAGVVIVCGVTIGKHAKIGAGSLVTHDIKERWLAYGSPAHHVRPLPLVANGQVKVNP